MSEVVHFIADVRVDIDFADADGPLTLLPGDTLEVAKALLGVMTVTPKLGLRRLKNKPFRPVPPTPN